MEAISILANNLLQMKKAGTELCRTASKFAMLTCIRNEKRNVLIMLLTNKMIPGNKLTALLTVAEHITIIGCVFERLGIG